MRPIPRPECLIMNIPPKYEDVVAQLEAALGREAALREELNQYEPASPGTASKRARWLLNIQDACKYGLPKHLVHRLNNTAKEIQNSIKFGGTKRLRDENESLQQRLTVAEQRAGELESALSSANSELKKMIPLMKSDESGNGPDCTSLFQSIIDTQEKLSTNSAKVVETPNYWTCRSREEFERFEKWKVEDDKATGESL